MNAFSEEINRAICSLMENFLFKKRQEKYSENFGDAFVLLASDVFWVRIISDRGQLFVDLSFSNCAEWYIVRYNELI